MADKEIRGMEREAILISILRELELAYNKHGKDPWGRHEFYGILLEEVDELWEETKKGGNIPFDEDSHRKEIFQVAAMCIRYLETGDRYQKVVRQVDNMPCNGPLFNKRRNFKDGEKELIVEMYQHGISPSMIAKEINRTDRSVGTVLYQARKNGKITGYHTTSAEARADFMIRANQLASS